MVEQDKEAEKQSWVVKEVQEFGVHDPYDESAYTVVIDHILDYIKKKELVIVDEGCGSSAYGLRLAKRGFEVIGLDIAPEIVESANRRAVELGVNASFRVCDIENTDLADSSVDVCLFGGVLHHFPDLNKVLNEATRVLKDGGSIVCIEPNKQNPHVWLSMEPKSPVRYKHLTVNERSIHFKEILSVLGDSVADYDVFYKLMTLTRKGRHATTSFLDNDLVYKIGGFAWKYVGGGIFRKLLAVVLYNVAHVFQFFASSKRKSNFVILTVKIKK